MSSLSAAPKASQPSDKIPGNLGTIPKTLKQGENPSIETVKLKALAVLDRITCLGVPITASSCNFSKTA
jgi:hypothetical protein